MPLPTAQLKKRAALIRYFLFDVDGVLSDGNIIHSVSVKGKTVRQTETKTFFVRDGYALKAAMKMGFGVGLLSARDSLVTAHRARELGITDCIQARHDKAAAFAELLRDKKMAAEEVARMVRAGAAMARRICALRGARRGRLKPTALRNPGR